MGLRIATCGFCLILVVSGTNITKHPEKRSETKVNETTTQQANESTKDDNSDQFPYDHLEKYGEDYVYDYGGTQRRNREGRVDSDEDLDLYEEFGGYGLQEDDEYAELMLKKEELR